MNIDKTWHLFLTRKALMTTNLVAYEFGVPNGSLRSPILRDAISSMCYIELLTILDLAFEARMTPDDYQRGGRSKNRIEMLAKVGDLLDPAGLLQINTRRNDIGHELDKGADVDELDRAVEVVKAQLLKWGLIQDRSPYELRWERSAMRGVETDGPYEQDFRIEILAAGRVCASLSQTKRFEPPD